MSSKKVDEYLGREFPMSDRNFSDIQAIAYQHTGISLSDHKKNMIYGRLSRRIRDLKIDNFNQYCELISQDNHPEHSDFINAITTNLTAFFRESHHFEFLKNTALPEIMRNHATDHRVRAWSAGCSTGEEPYSIAMIMQELMAGPTWDAKLLASDLDSNVVEHASTGVYTEERIESVSEDRKKRFFIKSKDDSDKVKIKPSVSDLITFKRLNLLHDWPMKGPFDFIFCRNVVIYFDKETQKKLFDRYADMIVPGGYLFIGHSESLHRVTDRFKSLGKTMYQRIK